MFIQKNIASAKKIGLGVIDITIPEAINTTGYLCTVIIMLMMFFGTLSMGNRHQKIYRYFFYVILLNLVISLCEMINWIIYLQGNVQDFAQFAIALENISYLCASLQVIFFSFYVFRFLSTRGAVQKLPFYISAASGVFGVICLLISLFNHMYFILDEYGRYAVQSGLWISQIPVYISSVIYFIMAIKYRKYMKGGEIAAMMAYIFVPVLVRVITEIWLAEYNIWLHVFAASILMFVIFINIQTDLRRQLEIKEKEAQISVMLSQIQPHFLYNSLEAMSELCYVDPMLAHKSIISFANYLRGNMDSITAEKMIPFSREIEHVKKYIELESLRFKDKLKVGYYIEAEDFMLPPLTLQPMVENAVRYGVTKKRDGGEIAIKTFQREEKIYIIIEDNGVGFDVNAEVDDGRSHLGIANVKERLRATCEGSLKIESEINKGTVVTITVPRRGDEHEYNSGR